VALGFRPVRLGHALDARRELEYHRAAVLPVLLRLLLLVSLFCAGIRAESHRPPDEHAVESAPADVLPAGEARSSFKSGLRATLAIVKPKLPTIYVAWDRRPSPTPQLQSHHPRPRSSCAHLLRRRVPRMRDDLGGGH
jgi:hypothetical protein